MKTQERREVTAIDAVIKHSQTIIILRDLKRRVHNLKKAIERAGNDIIVTTVDQLDVVADDIQSKISEKELMIKFHLMNIFKGADFDFEYSDHYFADLTALKQGYLFLKKTIKKNGNGEPIVTQPFILVLSNLKTNANPALDIPAREFKAGDLLPLHLCKESLKRFPSALGTVIKRKYGIAKTMEQAIIPIENLIRGDN